MISITTSIIIFFTYVIIDILYAMYIKAVGANKAILASGLSSVIYSLLAFGVITYAENPAYVIPLALGAFCGTYITVRFINL